MRLPQMKLQNSVLAGSFGGVCAMSLMLCTLPAGATDAAFPWECTGFAGKAQNRCIRTFAELQQEKIAKLEKDLEIQNQVVQELRQQVAQESGKIAELERQLTPKRSSWYVYPSVGMYPLVGLSLDYGRHGFYGGSLFYGQVQYFGPRLYRYGYRRWHRH